MKPILYESTETRFISNGLGRLADATKCVVTEERNGQFELEMAYPVTGIHFDDIVEERIICAPHDDTKELQPFRIYRITKPINGIVTINARHISYQLLKVVVMPMDSTSCPGALSAMKSHSVGDNPFTVWTDKTDTGAFTVERPTAFRTLLGNSNRGILDAFGDGEYEFDGYNVKLHQNRGQTTDVMIRYGKNLVDVKKVTDTSEVWTGIVPFWSGSAGAGESGTVVVTLTEEALFPSGTNPYPYAMVVPVDFSSEFKEQPTEEQLRSVAQTYLANNIDLAIPTTIDVSFVALWQTEEYKNVAPLQRLKLCDTVTVYHSALGINHTAKIVSTKYNVLLERYDSMTIGEVKGGLGTSIRTIAANAAQGVNVATRTAIDVAVEHATDLIRGGAGGNVVYGVDSDGKPQEIYIMDTADVNTAVNVLRMNYAGIGFSTSGIEGPFTTAWTIDGNFVADFITTGNLNASLITTGAIDADLITTGVFKIEKIVDGVSHELFFADADNGTVRICADSFSLTSGETLAGVQSAAETYTDTQVADAEANAKSYTDTQLQNYDPATAMNQQAVFNLLTNNGAIQGLYMSNGNMYINASYINTGTLSANLISGGTLKLGGSNDVDGVIEVYNGNGQKIGQWTKDGISISSGSISLGGNTWNSSGLTLNNGSIDASLINVGSISADDIYGGTLTLGGSGTTSLQVKNSNGVVIGQMTRSGINIYDGTFACEYWGSVGSKISITDGGIDFIWKNSNGNTSVGSIEADSSGIEISSSVSAISINGNLTVPNNSADAWFYCGVSINDGLYVKDDIDCYGNVDCVDLSASGTKSRLASTEDYGDRLLYCYESPSPMFGDVGEGVIGEDGYCYITIDPIFAETISTGNYQVFLQVYGDGKAFVCDRKATYFVVSGTPALSFGWEIKAKQAGYENTRLERKIKMPDRGEDYGKFAETITAENYAAMAVLHINSIAQERMVAA